MISNAKIFLFLMSVTRLC